MSEKRRIFWQLWKQHRFDQIITNRYVWCSQHTAYCNIYTKRPIKMFFLQFLLFSKEHLLERMDEQNHKQTIHLNWLVGMQKQGVRRWFPLNRTTQINCICSATFVELMNARNIIAHKEWNAGKLHKIVLISFEISGYGFLNSVCCCACCLFDETIKIDFFQFCQFSRALCNR